MSQPTPEPVEPLPGDLPGVPGEFEYRLLTLPRGTSRSEARQLLTEHAADVQHDTRQLPATEYGRWELARVVLHISGMRRIWLRRRIIRVTRAL
jgi:hypothetical protein